VVVQLIHVGSCEPASGLPSGQLHLAVRELRVQSVPWMLSASRPAAGFPVAATFFAVK